MSAAIVTEARVQGLGKRGHLIAALDDGRFGIGATGPDGSEVRLVLELDEVRDFIESLEELADMATPATPEAVRS